MTSAKKKTSLVSFGCINQFTLTGVVIENTDKTMVLRVDATEFAIRIDNPAKRDFSGCFGVVWGHLNKESLTAEHYHIFTPEGERIHAS